MDRWRSTKNKPAPCLSERYSLGETNEKQLYLPVYSFLCVLASAYWGAVGHRGVSHPSLLQLDDGKQCEVQPPALTCLSLSA